MGTWRGCCWDDPKVTPPSLPPITSVHPAPDTVTPGHGMARTSSHCLQLLLKGALQPPRARWEAPGSAFPAQAPGEAKPQQPRQLPGVYHSKLKTEPINNPDFCLMAAFQPIFNYHFMNGCIRVYLNTDLAALLMRQDCYRPGLAIYFAGICICFDITFKN